MPRSQAMLKLAVATLLACSVACLANEDDWLNRNSRALQMAEIGTDGDVHHTTPCNASVVGSVAACYNSGIKAANNIDFPFMTSPFTTYPTNGTAWGIYLTGPYPDGVSYLVSWESMAPLTGNPEDLANVTAHGSAYVKLAKKSGGTSASSAIQYSGKIVRYLRAYTAASNQKSYSYLSPVISHVVLKKLLPGTTYYYSVGDGSMWSAEKSFTTLPTSHKKAYPLRVGLLADIGQTVNSSITLQHILANKPQVVINTADYTYADNYGANDVNNANNGGNGTNQNRWDTHAVMWEPLFSTVPILGAAGNHEIESTGIPAVINYTTTSFSYPTNYPFQSYSARHPVAGTTSAFGNIDNNMYYSTVIAGVIKLITLNNYIPFHPGTPQYQWAVNEFTHIDRSATPWLFVQFHAPPYHTYYTHYKEMECFMSFYEDIFYEAGVDIVLNGHVHAYERTHPVYKYQVDTCAPVYITIGDGGNVEGPYRNFVDEINPATNKTYCEALNTNGLSPNQVQAAGGYTWGPSYQRQAHPPNCPTTSWQPPSGVAGGPVLVPLANSSTPLGFCQSSQPLWSAYRDPSFGHGILDIMSDRVVKMSWFRNIDGLATSVDEVTLERLDGCAARRAQMPMSRKMAK